MRKLYYNGIIHTLEKTQPAQAFLVENGVFKEIGNSETLLSLYKASEKIDLQGKTVIPAFIDAHSHLSSYANSFLQAPLSGSESFEDIVARLQTFAERNQLKEGQWIIASGYDHNLLKEKKHPTRELLDSCFPDNPVVLQHKSGHFGVFNSVALRALKLTDKSGTGYLEENAFIEAGKRLPLPDSELLLKAYQKAMEQYAACGITTVQEGMMLDRMLPLYEMLLKHNALFLDVVGYPQAEDWELFCSTFPESISSYDRHFRLGGCKIILDGSPQGRTAWMRSPYAGAPGYFGVSTMTDDQVANACAKALRDGYQLLAHCNGDAAAAQLLSGFQKTGNPKAVSAIRPVMIHAQLLAEDQLPDVKELGIIPSFFVAHCYHWGDTHIQNFGMERAAKISLCHSAQKQGILFTFHQDTPVIEPDMLETIWCAVNRKTKSGVFLDPDERISPEDALKAVTINAAYQYGEEKQKGSIAPGKHADFTVLDQDLLSISPERINQISVLATYKNGKCLYERAQ